MRQTQLRSFHAVALHGSFTAAARALHVSQPTVTAQVKALEETYGVELFFRRGRRLQLTDLGRQLLQISQRVIEAEKEAIELLTESRELLTGHLKVGAVGPYHVTEMLAAFNRGYPNVQVSVALNNSRKAAEDVLDYRTDVAVLAHIDEDPRLLAIPYSRHDVVVFAHRDHPLAGHRRVPINALEGAGVIMREQGSTTRRAFEEALASAGVQPRVVMEIGSRESIREAVARGIGLGVVSEAEFTPGERLRVIRIADAEIFTYAHVVCLRERRHRRLIAAFLGVVRGLLAERAAACGSSPETQ
jgi:aminoethylphosphonate catabolism LysR family transcriptional regulator